MHVPGWWQFTLLALGVYRLVRLVGWDDLPPVARARGWLLGEWVETVRSHAFGAPEEIEVTYQRPLLAHFIHCPFCVGFWISAAVWGFWLWSSTPTLMAMTPFAISGIVGLIARNLDP